MTRPPEEDAPNPAEATRAEYEPRSGRNRFVMIVLIILVVGTIWVSQEVRKRRMAGSSPGATELAPDSPAPAGGLPLLEVAAEIQSVANRIRAAWKRDGAPPASLDGLPPDEDDPPGPDSPSRRDPPLDSWGRPYVLERSEKDGRVVLVLTTYGSDGAPGGIGDAMDMDMELGEPED